MDSSCFHLPPTHPIWKSEGGRNHETQLFHQTPIPFEYYYIRQGKRVEILFEREELEAY